MREAFNRKSIEGILHLQALIKTLFNLFLYYSGKVQARGGQFPHMPQTMVDYDCEFEKIKVANILNM